MSDLHDASAATARTRHSGFGRVVYFFAVLSFIVAVVAIILALVAPFGYRFGLFDLGVAFQWFLRPAVFGAMFALSVGFLTAVILLFLRPKAGILAAFCAFLISLGFLSFLMPQLQTARSVPPIHDISTDTENPPVFVAILELREGAPNPPDYVGDQVIASDRSEKFGGMTVRDAQAEAYPDIEPQYYDAPPDVVFERAIDAATGLGWTIVAQVKAEGRIEAYERSMFFGFIDDVVIRIRSEDDGRTRLDIRSKSRVGLSDIGVNTARIRAFFGAMETSGPSAS